MMAPPASAKRLLDFIAEREAPHGYDTVYGNHQARMPKPLSAMTVDEAIANGPWRTRAFGSSACGRYQFMRDTLVALKKALRLTGGERLSPATQDALGYKLLQDRGFDRFMAGTLGIFGFGLGIAKEWASFPVLVDVQGQRRRVARGQSFYAGDGLNRALVRPTAVESVLQSLRDMPSTAEAEPSAVVAAPRVEAVPGPSIVKRSLLGWLFGREAPTPAEKFRPGLRPHGSAELWDIQQQLRARAYYSKGELDGLDGPLTQSAVAQARKDNGLGDGGVDDAFLAILPTLPPRLVPKDLASLPIRRAVAEKPELFSPLKWLGGTGIGMLGLGGASGSGLLDQVQSAAGRVNDVAGSVQTVFGTIESVVAFLVEHKTVVLILLGIALILKAIGMAADYVTKIRAAFF